MRRRSIFSVDGYLSIPFEEINKVCMTPSIHALLQYLLLFDYETVAHHTCYFTGYAVSEQIASRLPGVWYPIHQTGTRPTLGRMFKKTALRLSTPFRYPFLGKAEIFAFDVGFVPPLIGRHSYSLLSDGPLGISQNMQLSSAEYQRQMHHKHTLQGRAEKFLFGPVAVSGWGNNPQCKSFYLTEPNTAVVFQDKPIYIDSLSQLWNKASQESRDFVRYVFDVNGDDIDILNSKRYMFLSQPLVKDGILSEAEYLQVLESIFSHYDQSQLLIKLHPRDDFDYKRHFPLVTVYGKKVNMQLLVILGANVERAATICSSSINSFPESVEADWYGVDIHPKLRKWFGEMALPYRSFNQM